MQNNKLLQKLHELLNQRIELVKQVAHFKQAHHLPALDEKRFDDMVKKRIARGRELGLKESWIRTFYDKIHQISLRVENGILIHSKIDSSHHKFTLEDLRRKIDKVDDDILQTCSKMDGQNKITDHLDQLMNAHKKINTK